MAEGLAIVAFNCDGFGVVKEVIRDDLGLLTEARSLPSLVTSRSMSRAFGLLEAARTQEAISDWRLEFKGPAGAVELSFAAVRVPEGICLVGSQESSDDVSLLEELLEMNNQHVNAVRESLKQASLRARDDDALDELMELNNEMAALQRQLAKNNARLEELNEQKNRLLGMAAHDLRNPISVIRGYTEFMLEEEDMVGDEAREILGLVLQSSTYMLELLGDLLDVSAIESGKVSLSLGEVALPDLLQRVTDGNRSIGERKQIELELDAEGLPDHIRADGIKLEQVLHNLLSNAIKYSHSGTRVALIARREGADVVLAVQDQGQGIPAAELPTLFEPFQTTSVRSTGGEKSTGLGLAIVRKIVEEHGGQVSVQSEVGAGTRFEVRMPIAGPVEADEGD